MPDYKIIDNFLDEALFQQLQDQICGGAFSWYKSDGIAEAGDYGVYFTHNLYNNFEVQSDIFYQFKPLIDYINPKGILRAKLNLYLRANEVEKHGMHVDRPFEHKGVLFYINTNNGVTTLEDGTEIASVANRLMLFDSSKPHSSSSCSDEDYRITLNINYL